MKYYLDCEFNGMGGELLSLALVSDTERSLYLIRDDMPADIEPWVANNVLPILHAEIHAPVGKAGRDVVVAPLETWPDLIEGLLAADGNVTIVTDWPDDIKYFCELILTGPGTMIEVRPGITFEMVRVDAYPTTLPGAIQHNAYWDAMALRHKLEGGA